MVAIEHARVTTELAVARSLQGDPRSLDLERVARGGRLQVLLVEAGDAGRGRGGMGGGGARSAAATRGAIFLSMPAGYPW
jgi:hypothetical protein